MTWPTEINCHNQEPRYRDLPIEWRQPDLYPNYDRDSGDPSPYGYPYRTCSYCGSMHPEDFIRFLNDQCHVDLADMKYGWPHKIYIDVPNPMAGKRVRSGSRSWQDEETKERREEKIWGTGGPFTHAKFYTQHVNDLQPGPEFEVLREAFAIRLGVLLVLGVEGLSWKRIDFATARSLFPQSDTGSEEGRG